MRAPRIVSDTNIIVSSLLSGDSPPAQIRRAFYAGELELCISKELFDEYVEVLGRPKIKSRIERAGAGSLDDFINRIQKLALWVVLSNVPQVVARDPKDDMVVATALAANADFIVTGDADLSDAESVAGIRILSARDFVTEFFQSNNP